MNFRKVKDRLVKHIFMMIALSAIIVIFSILLFLFFQAAPAFQELGLQIFGLDWKYGNFGLGAIIWMSILVTIIAVVVAVPLGIGSAFFLSELAPYRLRVVLKPTIELLASIPSVIYGFIGLMILLPFLVETLNLNNQFSILAGGIIIGVMAVPIVVTMSDDAIKAVPRSMKEASLALGSTRWQTIKKVIFPTAISGIFASAILAIGKAIGETMAVLMLIGNRKVLPLPFFDIFQSGETLTALIANDMAESSGLHQNVLFAAGVVLFVIVGILSITSDLLQRRIEKKFKGES